ncbi:LysR family transcriptional regulator [Martelella soudanensis]|uniref:LysR family transcriptional regulator n=1 Tax=unclassified Martelella TaxID=2629616 RepID=UPI001FEDC4A6|nr:MULTISPECIES: LysR family transcriptional regulator [unclassified Martelella]
MSISNDKISDVKTLEAFQAAMACGSMTAAARQLGIGQPAVTRQIRELEDSVGFPLFHRNGPRISPTERGLQFYDEVQRLMSGLHQIRERAAAIRDGRIAAIDIAATPTMAGGLLSPTLAHMGDDLPGVVNIETMNAEHVARALTSRTADFGISALPLEHATLEAKVICGSRLVAAIAEGGPFDVSEPLPLESLAVTRLLTVGNAYRIRGKINGALERDRIVPAAEIVTNSSLNAMMAARAGLGIAIIDPVTAFGIPVEGVSIRPLAVDLPYVWGLFSAAGRVLPSELLSFVAGFEAACSTTIPDCVFHDPSDVRSLERSGV